MREMGVCRMKFKRLVVVCLMVLLSACGLLGLVGCGPSDEEIIRKSVTDELESIKNLDPDVLSQVIASPGVDELSSLGVDPKEFMTSYLTGFDYKIENVVVNGDTAQVSVVLTGKSFSTLSEGLAQVALDLSTDEDVANMNEEEISKLFGQSVMELLSSIQPVVMPPIEFQFTKQDNVWSLTDDATQTLASVLLAN